MLLGQFHSALDEGQYLTLPAAFREVLEGGAYITQGFERNLVIMNEKAFQVLYDQVVAMNIANPLTRLLLRVILGNAARVELDEKGRLSIQDKLSEFACLDQKVVLVGQGDYVEIWAGSLWNTQSTDVHDADANAGRFAVFNLATR